jgi:hypothetical protein
VRRAIHAAADLPDKCAISPLRRELPPQRLAKHRAQKLISAAAPIASPCSSPFRKNNLLYENQNPWIIRPSRFLLEGRIAIVTDVGRGMRWTREWHMTNAARADG